jgi:hypothetical protein
MLHCCGGMTGIRTQIGQDHNLRTLPFSQPSRILVGRVGNAPTQPKHLIYSQVRVFNGITTQIKNGWGSRVRTSTFWFKARRSTINLIPKNLLVFCYAGTPTSLDRSPAFGKRLKINAGWDSWVCSLQASDEGDTLLLATSSEKVASSLRRFLSSHHKHLCGIRIPTREDCRIANASSVRLEPPCGDQATSHHLGRLAID